jgi:Myb-like DNA-binding domain
MTRRSPFSVKDNNINDTTPRRSTRVSARKLIKAYGSASSKSPTVPPPIPAMTKTRGGIITRKRRVTLSPSSSPSYRKMKAASEQGTASTDTHTPSSITKIIPSKKRRSTVTSSKKPPKRPKIGRWEKWEQIAFLQGLREHGRGHWKTIAESIPTRYGNLIPYSESCISCCILQLGVNMEWEDSSVRASWYQTHALQLLLPFDSHCPCTQNYRPSQDTCTSRIEEARRWFQHL